VKPGSSATWDIKVENDGNLPDAFSVKGCASSKGFTVVFKSGSTDITKKVKAGTYKTTTLVGDPTDADTSASTAVIGVRLVSAKSDSRSASKSCLVTVTSTHATGPKDAVKAVLEMR
jgi:uncharacterized membrane protein